MYTYTPRGVCSRRIDIQLDGDTVKDVVFTGGCNGNLKGISKIIKGMPVDHVIEVFDGGPRPTSCADQLARALREAKNAPEAQA